MTYPLKSPSQLKSLSKRMRTKCLFHKTKETLTPILIPAEILLHYEHSTPIQNTQHIHALCPSVTYIDGIIRIEDDTIPLQRQLEDHRIQECQRHFRRYIQSKRKSTLLLLIHF